jgi:hypothetical protein
MGMEDTNPMPPKSSTAKRNPYTLRWTIKVSDALDKEVARRIATQTKHNEVNDRSTVSEDILRTFLGVGES